MNTNFFRTIMGFFSGTGMVALAARLAGCTIDDPATAVVEVTSCAGSTLLASIHPLAIVIGTGVFMLIGSLAKLAKGGTFAENIAAPSVPVVAKEAARPGVVTKTQVESDK